MSFGLAKSSRTDAGLPRRGGGRLGSSSVDFPKKYFSNTIRIHVKNKQNFIVRKNIYDGLFSIINDDVNQITYISQFNNNTNWYITFNENYPIEQLFDKEIKIAD